MKIPSLIPLIVILLAIMCQQTVFPQISDAIRQDNTNKSLLNINNYDVLFFYPNRQELKKLAEEYDDDTLFEVDADFRFYINTSQDSLSKLGLKVHVVREKVIKYTVDGKPQYLDRLQDRDQLYGIIFNDENCDPKILFGVMTDIDIYQELSAYRKACQHHGK